MFSNKVIDLTSFNPNLINYINDLVKNNIFSNIIIVLNSTKGLTTEMINLITKSNKLKFRIKSGLKTEDVSKKDLDEINSIITYTKDELYNIVYHFEKIEKEVNSNFSNLEKAFYDYENLRKYFSYKYYKENEMTKENSLKGIVSKNVSNLSVALIYKEILNRLDINTQLVKGVLQSLEFKKKHYWNIIEIDGKFIAVDLYLENKEYLNGYEGNSMYFGNISSFINSHKPSGKEPIQYYENTLYSINNVTLATLYKTIKDSKEEKFSINIFERKDKTEGLYAILEKNDLLKLVYYDIENKAVLNPSILYLKCDLDIKKLSYEEEDIIYNEVLSKTNIATNLSLRKGYLGILKKENKKLIYDKDENNKGEIKDNQKNIKRSDGSVFLVEQINFFNKENITIGNYNIYELLNSDKGYIILKNILYTEKNLFLSEDQKLYDSYLSRKNIDKTVLYNNSYLEVYNPGEIKIVEKKEN